MPTENDAPRTASIARSLISWLSLLLAVALLAAVALAPKLMTYLRLRERYVQGQIRLVRLEREVHDLSRVKDALVNDPNFADELARSEFGAIRPSEERIPVADALAFPPATGGLPGRNRVRRRPAHWWLLEALSSHRQMRDGVLCLAAVLTVASFTTTLAVRSRPLDGSESARSRLLQPLSSRYRKSPAGSDLSSS